MTSTGKVAVAEFVATFALVFIGAGAIVAVGLGLDLTGVALAHGLVLAIMVSITAHVSGGHINPAVTISLWVAGKTPTPIVLVYIAAGVLIVGACVVAAWPSTVEPAQPRVSDAVPLRARIVRAARGLAVRDGRTR